MDPATIIDLVLRGARAIYTIAQNGRLGSAVGIVERLERAAATPTKRVSLDEIVSDVITEDGPVTASVRLPIVQAGDDDGRA